MPEAIAVPMPGRASVLAGHDESVEVTGRTEVNPLASSKSKADYRWLELDTWPRPDK
jgi:hypothetical protein